MAFDAGTIIARMDLDDDDFDRKLRADVAKIEAFEKGSHGIKITPAMDESGMQQARRQFERFDRQVTQDAQRRSRSGNGSILGALAGLFRGGDGAAAGGGGGLLSSLGGAAGPGMLGVGGLPALIGAGAGVGLGALPALVGPLAAGGVGTLGIGAVALGASQLIGSKNQAGQAATQGPLYAPAQAAMKQLKDMFQQSAQPLIAPLRQVFGMIPALARQIGPDLKSMFAGAATLILPVVHGLTDLAHMVLPLLGQAFRAAAPAMRPLLDGVGMLVRGMLPGLITMLKAAHPAVMVFAQILGTLGRDIGTMFRDFAPVMRSSAVILKALLDVVGALFPVIGRLAAIAAQALAPAFVAFAAVLKSLMPVLVQIGHIAVEFLAAALDDLVGVLKPVALLIRDLAPSFAILAVVLGSVFKQMENTGVFQVLANALEKIAPPLAQMINLLIKDLAPDLPVIMKLIASLSDVLINLLATGLTTVLNGVVWLLKTFPGLIQLLGLLAAAWVIVDAVMSANPIGLIIIAIVALIGAVTLLITHWRQVWGAVRDVAMAAWNFLTHGWGQWLVPGLTLIRLAVSFLSSHWRGAWDDITGAAEDAWHVIERIGGWIADLFTQTLPGAFRAGVSAIGNAWNAVEGAVRAPVAWVVDHVIDGLISAFDWISGKVGGPHITAVHPFGLATGGRIPGYGGGDSKLIAVEPGEAVISKETTAANAGLLAALGVPGFQHGGPITPLGTRPGGATVGGLVRGGLHMLSGGGKILAALATGNSVALANAFMGMFGHGTGGAIGDLAGLLTAIPAKLVHDAVSFLVSKAKTAFGTPFTGHYGAGVAQWKGTVLQALGMEGLPLDLASRVLFQMQTESGGNPNAINLTDSNAAAGDPSRGLLQTIMSTFRSFHWPGTSWNIYNPLANVAAAINYAIHRYGPSLMSNGMGMGSGHGYDDGGWLTGGPNTTGKPEAVLNPGQSAAFLNLAEAAHRLSRGGGSSALLRDVHLMLPEGTTLAEALREIGWALRTTRQQAFTGVSGG